MKRFVIIIRGPVAGISGENSMATEEELEQIRTWLKGLKSSYEDMLYQKFSGHQMHLTATGNLDSKLINQIDGGEISQIVTLILPDWEEAQRIATTFPFVSSFYSIELREMA
ncbi:hypothetical protein EWU23_12840 [Cytophagaceae bacterium 50C-KIRBA]|uniref:PH domain-containing protein n=1 Tax=Aquirufa beregesia TaxID=2516556 RepID=A0ABX0EZ99_9BACT|nr:hypothetical protein [Aquirufa beregesia]NGZ45365.1 hypothetical protein [Aquirufa beregesia]